MKPLLASRPKMLHNPSAGRDSQVENHWSRSAFPNLFKTRTIFGPVYIFGDSRWTKTTRMKQTLGLANLVDRPHSQISMRIMSLNLFHKFVEVKACGLQRTPDWSWFRCLVLKIVIVLKNSFTMVRSWKKQMSICYLPTQIKTISLHGMDIYPKFRQRLHNCRLYISVSCSAMQSISQWICSSGTSKRLRIQSMFWCNCEKGCICPTPRDVVRRSRKIWRMQRKLISTLLQTNLPEKLFFHL